MAKAFSIFYAPFPAYHTKKSKLEYLMNLRYSFVRDQGFTQTMNDIEKAAWLSFVEVI